MSKLRDSGPAPSLRVSVAAEGGRQVVVPEGELLGSPGQGSS